MKLTATNNTNIHQLEKRQISVKWNISFERFRQIHTSTISVPYLNHPHLPDWRSEDWHYVADNKVDSTTDNQTDDTTDSLLWFQDWTGNTREFHIISIMWSTALSSVYCVMHFMWGTVWCCREIVRDWHLSQPHNFLLTKTNYTTQTHISRKLTTEYCQTIHQTKVRTKIL